MKKQIILAASALILVAVFFVFGKTSISKPVSASQVETQTFNITAFIDSSEAGLPAGSAVLYKEIKNSGRDAASFNRLAEFWRDSARLFEPYAYYTAEAAKLDNSQKNLTFAARLFLERIRHEQDASRLDWETTTAIDLYERAIALDTTNNDLRVELGSVYVYGRGRSGDPQATMQGIQELLAVSRKDPGNMKAQIVLGVGGLVSGQYDKAIERFKLVVSKEPGNLEAIAYLADTYAASGNKEEAIKWYNVSKQVANNPLFTKEVDERIRQLK